MNVAAESDGFPADLGIILVDHGSKLPAANALLLEVVELFKGRTSASIVEAAHMEIASPSLSEAFAACVAQGAKRIVIHPYFLAPGRHSQEDIPRMAEESARSYPGIQWSVSQPLGLDARMIDVVAARLREVLDRR